MMSARPILYAEHARERLLRGVEKPARTVRVTLGPKGRHVLIDASVASLLLTTEALIATKKDRESGGAPGGMPDLDDDF